MLALHPLLTDEMRGPLSLHTGNVTFINLFDKNFFWLLATPIGTRWESINDTWSPFRLTPSQILQYS